MVWQGTVEEFDTTGKHALLLCVGRALSGCLFCLFGLWMMPCAGTGGLLPGVVAAGLPRRTERHVWPPCSTLTPRPTLPG